MHKSLKIREIIKTIPTFTPNIDKNMLSNSYFIVVPLYLPVIISNPIKKCALYAGSFLV